MQWRGGQSGSGQRSCGLRGHFGVWSKTICGLVICQNAHGRHLGRACHYNQQCELRRCARARRPATPTTRGSRWPTTPTCVAVARGKQRRKERLVHATADGPSGRTRRASIAIAGVLRRRVLVMPQPGGGPPGRHGHCGLKPHGPAAAKLREPSTSNLAEWGWIRLKALCSRRNSPVHLGWVLMWPVLALVVLGVLSCVISCVACL